MSSRYHSYDKGSSRSTRDDSRTSKDKHVARRDRRGTKSRSRSPRRQASPSSSREPRYSPERSRSPRHRQKSPSSSRESKYSEKSPKSHEKDFEEVGTESPPGWEEKESDEDVPAPPPPPRISKISIGFTKPKAPIKMSLTGPSKSNTIMPKPTVAAVFAEDDDEPEEMPAEAKMRMRNIGRETPTSTGPNSFGKTKQGFCDAKKVFEKNLKQALETADKPASSKFPQTIYKIKGP